MSLLAAAMVALILPGVPSFDLRHQMPTVAGAVPSQQVVVAVAEQPEESTVVAEVIPETAPVVENESAEPEQKEIASAPNLFAIGALAPDLQLESESSILTPSALLAQPAILAAYRPNPPTIEQPVHKFWDRANKIGFAVHGVARVADAVQSCILLTRPGTREAWLPTKSCSGIAIYSLSMIPAQIGTSYLMHRKGHHHLERWVPYFWATPTAAGIAVSIKAW